MSIRDVYREWLREETAQAAILPDYVVYNTYISRSKGKGRRRKYIITIELISFDAGATFSVVGDIPKWNQDVMVQEALEGIRIPPDINEFEYFKSLLRGE